MLASRRFSIDGTEMWVVIPAVCTATRVEMSEKPVFGSSLTDFCPSMSPPTFPEEFLYIAARRIN
jgi:hypothetical protein